MLLLCHSVSSRFSDMPSVIAKSEFSKLCTSNSGIEITLYTLNTTICFAMG